MNKNQGNYLLHKYTDMIHSETLRSFVEDTLENAPDYFYINGASSSGKYHPSYGNGDGGLLRHTLAALKIANSLFEAKGFMDFDMTDQDIIYSALTLHDLSKYGWGENPTMHTGHEHPVTVHHFFPKYDSEDWLIQSVIRGIERHMGCWTTSRKSKVVLPAPETNAEKFIHLCDYLASRKFLEVVWDKTDGPVTVVEFEETADVPVTAPLKLVEPRRTLALDFSLLNNTGRIKLDRSF